MRELALESSEKIRKRNADEVIRRRKGEKNRPRIFIEDSKRGNKKGGVGGGIRVTV